MSTRSTLLYSIILVITCEVMISLALSISENQTVSVGDTVTIVCTTKLSETVHWKHKGVGEKRIDYVYRGENGFDEKYNNTRFRLEKRDEESYALVISNITKSDAGNYICIDNDGMGNKTTSEIVIVESPPNCRSNISTSGVVGENSCGIAPDYIGLICSLNYVGHIAPTLEWRLTDNGDVITTGAQVSTSSPLTSSTLSVPASSATDTSKYNCRVKMHHPQSYTCKPEHIHVMYAVNSSESIQIDTNKAVFMCFANVSDHLQCSYKWVNSKGRDITDEQTIDLHDPEWAKSHGNQYQCLADCKLGSKICRVKGSHLRLEQGDTTSAGMTIVFVCIGGIVVLIIVVVVVIIRWRYAKKKNTQQSAENPDSSKMETLKPSSASNQNDQPNGNRPRENEQENPRNGQHPLAVPNQDPNSTKMEMLNPSSASNQNNPPNGNRPGENGQENPRNGQQPLVVPNQVVIEDSREVLLPDNSNLIGIDCLEDKIYALSFNLKCIFVFSDVAPYDELKNDRIWLKSTELLDDIACCRTCRALFVSDYTEKKLVFKIDILNKDVTMWPMGGKPSKLSTTASGNLLVIVRGTNKAFLEIYNSADMNKLNTVDFPGDTVKPIKAIENFRGQLILLYRNQNKRDVIAEIMVNEAMGSSSVVRSMNLSNQRADESRQLSHLAIGRDDMMYIADDGNMKILRVDRTFEECNVFRQFQAGGMPYRLCYVRESGKLMAGQWSPGLFQIFGNA